MLLGLPAGYRWGKERVVALEVGGSNGASAGLGQISRRGPQRTQGRAGPVTEHCRAKPVPHH